MLLQYTAYSLTGIEAIATLLHQSEPISLAEWPLFQLGVPALLLLAAAGWLRRQRDGAPVRALEAAAAGLGAVMVYFLARHAFHDATAILSAPAGFTERGVAPNLLLVYSLACLFAGRRFGRSALAWSGATICAWALLRILYFDLLLHNPLWTNQRIDGWPVLNALLLTFGLPLAWIALSSRELQHIGWARWARLLRSTIPVLLFVLVSLNVRHLFQGRIPEFTGRTGDRDLYLFGGLAAVWHRAVAGRGAETKPGDSLCIAGRDAAGCEQGFPLRHAGAARPVPRAVVLWPRLQPAGAELHLQPLRIHTHATGCAAGRLKPGWCCSG